MTFIVTKGGKSTWSLSLLLSHHTKEGAEARVKYFPPSHDRCKSRIYFPAYMFQLANAPRLISTGEIQRQIFMWIINVLFRNLLRCKNLCNVKFLWSWMHREAIFINGRGSVLECHKICIDKSESIWLKLRINIVAGGVDKSLCNFLTFRAAIIGFCLNVCFISNTIEFSFDIN